MASGQPSIEPPRPQAGEIVEESTWGFGGGADAGFPNAAAVPVKSLGVMGKGVKRKQATDTAVPVASSSQPLAPKRRMELTAVVSKSD